MTHLALLSEQSPFMGIFRSAAINKAWTLFPAKQTHKLGRFPADNSRLESSEGPCVAAPELRSYNISVSNVPQKVFDHFHLSFGVTFQCQLGFHLFELGTFGEEEKEREEKRRRPLLLNDSQFWWFTWRIRPKMFDWSLWSGKAINMDIFIMWVILWLTQSVRHLNITTYVVE